MEVGKLTATAHGRTIRFEVQGGQPATVGRSSRCTVRLADPKVSREHCRLELLGDRLRVVDLESSQGLAYRGRRVAEFEIEVGDGFHIGQTFVRFEAVHVLAAEAAVAETTGGDEPRSRDAAALAGADHEPRPQDELPQGTQLGAFTIEAVLGRSDRCTVYRAQQVALRREVALKVLREDPYDARAAQERELFLADVRTAASVQDPRLVQVLDIPAAAEHCYASLELVKGHSLAERIGVGQRWSWQEVVAVLADVLQALEVLHGRGLIHGAVQPANVFVLATGTGMLADARATPRRRSRELPCYSAPEQLAGQPVDHRADLYDLGCVAYAALAGQPPFEGSAQDIAAAQREYSPQSLLDVDPTIPPGLDEFVCVRLLALDPADRPANAAAARAELLDPSTTAPPKPVSRGAGAGGSHSLEAYAARPELRRRPPPRSKVLLARLAAESIIFTIHFVVVVGLLLGLKIAFSFDIYQMLPDR